MWGDKQAKRVMGFGSWGLTEVGSWLTAELFGVLAVDHV